MQPCLYLHRVVDLNLEALCTRTQKRLKKLKMHQWKRKQDFFIVPNQLIHSVRICPKHMKNHHILNIMCKSYN